MSGWSGCNLHNPLLYHNKPTTVSIRPFWSYDSFNLNICFLIGGDVLKGDVSDEFEM